MGDNKQVILIGGIPTAGKSTMAKILSQHLGLPWFSTDQIKIMAQTVADRQKYPDIFNFEGYAAEEYLTQFSAEHTVKEELDQAEVLWPAAMALIKEDFCWPDGLILEGVGILPRLVAKDFGDRDNVKAVFLVDQDGDRIRDVVYSRGVWGNADSYSDDVKDKEIEWISLYSSQLKTEVEKHGYPWVEVRKQTDDLDAVLKALNLK